MSPANFHFIEYRELSDPGLVRSNNEDALSSLPADGCFLVSDGMGGGSAGELASQIVEDSVSGSITGSAHDSPGLRKYSIQQAIHRANRKIHDYAEAHHFQQMGATLALLLFNLWTPQKVMICHVGDSRVYRFRHDKLTLLTCDHTIGSELAKKNADSTWADHQNSSLSHILTRSIGTGNNVLPEWQETECVPGDVFLICSDGVSTMLSDQEMQVIFGKSADLPENISTLETAIRERGAKDNYTIILCKIASELPEAETHSPEEQQENSYLLKISEERIDHA